MWIVLIAVALSAIAWLADLKASHIPIREDEFVNDFPELKPADSGISRLLDR